MGVASHLGIKLTEYDSRIRTFIPHWSHEDDYVPLDAEIALMRSSGFRVELLWRRGAFAVIRAARSF